MIDPIYTAAEAAEIIGVSETWLRSKLRDYTFAAMKRAGRWAMTERQVQAAIDAMSTEAMPAPKPSPAGLVKNSRYRRRIQRSA